MVNENILEKHKIKRKKNDVSVPHQLEQKNIRRESIRENERKQRNI